jgi:hypothetical protein
LSYYFPFGEEVKSLKQIDQTPKKVFVLGVYASAVHAKWVCDKKIICQALAVASEPYIFWNGDSVEAQVIIDKIRISPKLGKLVLPIKSLNGPSGNVLTENILKPLGLSRKEAWLCDMLPESRINPKQLKVIRERYNPLIKEYDLNEVTVPIEDGKFCDENRRREITKEIKESKAEYLILLGDMPIIQYLKYEDKDIGFINLKEYVLRYGYGKPSTINLDGYKIKVMPIAHPRQIGRLGSSNLFWHNEHIKWEEKQ